jgi:hypothetical protein
MFEISSKKVDFNKENLLIKRNINLNTNLDCFILISTNNANFWDLILNNILDFLIDKISKTNAYNDFSVALENINSFIKNWKVDSDQKLELDIIIWILNDNNYIFSNIWKSSCYLINKNNEVIELTNKEENKKEFNYVSSWEISNNEIIISSTKRLLNYLSKSDLLDGLVLSEDIKIFNKNITNILLSELLEENILVSSLKYITQDITKKATKLDLIKDNLIKFLDNKFSKNILGYLLVQKDKLNSSSKMIKNIVFLSWITIWVIFLYSILSTVIWITTQNEEKELAKENIIKAKTYLRIASENVANPDVFELNIKNAEDLLISIEEDQIFLNDISKINDDINILKKQFNKIEIFEQSPENIIYTEDFENPIKIVENINNLKPYVITAKGIVWPILPNTKAKNYIFNSLEENEVFIDATFIWDDIYLLTSLSKIVKFTKNWYFSYMDVSWQKTWEKTKEISSYAQNIYLIWEDDNQIYKHSLNWNTFRAADWYLQKDDLTQIWEILSITIDWWFYILKKDLSIIKFFSNPYRIEKIVINKLPKNYDIENSDSIIDLKARADLNYVYLLMNNKVWVFKPNTTNYQNTKSLTYLWQIEWDKDEIKDFFINHDWEIMILNSKWLYKITFEISDERLLIR